MISMVELEAFLVAAEELHFGRAAERLYISPSRVSQLVRSLESQVGTALFERTTRRVELTTVGVQLERDLRRTYADLLGALQRARSAAQGLEGKVRIGYLTHCGDEAFTSLVAGFRTAHSSVEVNMTDLTGTDYHEVLRTGAVDLALGRFHDSVPADLVQGPVMSREQWLLGVARDHPLAGQGDVSVELLATHPIFGIPDAVTGELHNPLYPANTPQGETIPRRGVARTFTEVLALVARQENVFPATTSFPRYYAHPDVVFLPLVGWPSATRTLRWRRHGHTAPVSAFVEMATAEPAPVRPGHGDWWGPRALDEGLPNP